ncbi:MAG TPA: alpha/beta hydrolase [Gammaproteobacteria bacterium]
MRSQPAVRYLCTMAFCVTAAAVAAKEVTLQHRGLTLNADLEFATGKTFNAGMVLITHGALAHREMEFIVYLRKIFKDKGYNTLAINLSLGLNNRHGMYDCRLTHRHHNDNAIHEIGAWVDWLKKQGAKNITLLGHSRGGAQTALYAAERDDDLLNAVVLLAPAVKENTDPAAYQQRYQRELAPLLRQAQQLLEQGKGDAVLEHIGLMTCRDTSATAGAFVSYYGQDPRLDTPYLIPKFKIPVLVVIAGGDSVVVDLDKKLAPLADGKRVQMNVVDGADHLFRDLYTDDAVDAIDEFLKTVHD